MVFIVCGLMVVVVVVIVIAEAMVVVRWVLVGKKMAHGGQISFRS